MRRRAPSLARGRKKRKLFRSTGRTLSRRPIPSTFRTAGATPSTGGGALYGIFRHKKDGRAFPLVGARATRGTSARESFARASPRFRARIQMLFDPRRRPPVGRRLRSSTSNRAPPHPETKGGNNNQPQPPLISRLTTNHPTPMSAPPLQTTAAATQGGILTRPPRSRILATIGVDMYDYHIHYSSPRLDARPSHEPPSAAGALTAPDPGDPAGRWARLTRSFILFILPCTT